VSNSIPTERFEEESFLLEGTSRQPVAARLIIGLSADEVTSADAEWYAFLQQAVTILVQMGRTTVSLPEHKHWDWTYKQRHAPGDARFIGIECGNQMQGLMLVLPDKSSRLALLSGSRLVYVDYLAAAPWNLRGLVDSRRYLSVGRVLLNSAIRLSSRLGYEGRIGLHSLPQAENFYRVCGMTDLGHDPEYYGLRYFEMTPEQAGGLSETE
jgi:hypothetical protein